MANIIAIIWDFDKTLVDGCMEDPIFEEYGICRRERKAMAENAHLLLTYLVRERLRQPSMTLAPCPAGCNGSLKTEENLEKGIC